MGPSGCEGGARNVRNGQAAVVTVEIGGVYGDLGVAQWRNNEQSADDAKNDANSHGNLFAGDRPAIGSKRTQNVTSEF
jgi:hypothetical protein